MVRRGNILTSLRRRRASLGRFVFALFAFASASAGAAPCFAMEGSAEAIAPHESPAHVSPNHDHAHAAVHDRSMSVENGDRAPDACPHCPLLMGVSGDTSTSSHAFCSATDDLVDSGKTSVPLPLFKHVLSAAVIQIVPDRSQPSCAWTKHIRVDATAPSVALNLRHCVFLI
jgi:hypothetical protein